MKKSILLFILISRILFSQNQLILSPHPTEKGTKFSFSLQQIKSSNKPELKKLSEIKINSISVAGSFNQWRRNENFMTYDSSNQIWFVEIPLKEGIEYHYKFVINDTIWITDPNAPNVTEDEWQNGIIIPIGYNKPYAINVNPPFGKRITKLQEFSCELFSPQGKIVKSSIECFLNDKKIKFTFDERKNLLRIKLPKNLSEGEHKILLKFSDDKGNRNEGFLTKFFLDRYKAKIKTPEFYERAIVYEIFIRKFFDGNGDGVGDFIGLKSKLDYLKQLGVNALWLMPFNESSKEHGYNVIDYYSIEKDYGTFEDYLNFLKECKLRNIRVIKDIVINHCDTAFIYFRDAKNNPASKYSNWFQFTDSSNSTWKHFGIEIDMPKFNFENVDVQDYFIRFIKFWMDPNNDGNFEDGIDGIRCDAAKEIPHSFWNRLRKEIKKIRPDFLILGEVWDGANYLIPFFEDEFDMLFDYPLYYAMQRYFDGSDLNGIERTMLHQTEIYPNNFQMMRFLSNHDNHRALSLFNNDTLKYFQALVMLFTLPGTPMIYYGDEIGLIGRTPPENVRQKMMWDIFENNLIYNLHRKLIELRKNYKSLSEKFDSKVKSLKFISTNNQKVKAYLRKKNNEITLIMINNSDDQVRNLFVNSVSKNNKGKVIFALSDFLQGKNSEREIDLKNLVLQPREALILKLEN
ncbi:MAG: alpha-amylase family glycosyl hydrolase [Ignavibacteria bacterium]|nr:alpha-amylase family glycosyl hydrolase [Ignavibacteria bacterium]